MEIRIAFFDIDGTLLPPDHHLPESTVAALNILRAKGVQLYLPTGRPPYHLHYLKKDLPFEFDGMVMMNGQYCRDKDGCFYAHPLPQEGLRSFSTAVVQPYSSSFFRRSSTRGWFI